MKVLPESAFRGTFDTWQTAPDKDLRGTTAGTIAPRMKAMPTRNRPKTSLRAAARATTRRKKSTDRHRPGYEAPTRINARLVGTHIPIALADAFKRVAKSEHTTMDSLLRDFILSKVKATLPLEQKQALIEEEIARVHEKYGVLPTTQPHL